MGREKQLDAGKLDPQAEERFVGYDDESKGFVSIGQSNKKSA
jgi:hypothetical protein